MKRFAQLLEVLALTPSRNRKLEAMIQYFAATPDPDRGYALAILTGALSFKNVKPAVLRDVVTAEVDPHLFALSYDYVGDLGETIALIWPHHGAQEDLPSLTELIELLQHHQQVGAAEADRLAAHSRGDQRALGAGETRNRRVAHRRQCAAREDRARRDGRQGSAGARGDLARAHHALHRALRLARRRGRAAGHRPRLALPSADALATRSTRRRTSRCSIPPISPPSGNGTASACS